MRAPNKSEPVLLRVEIFPPDVLQSFITLNKDDSKSRQYQALPSNVHGKIWPHSTQFWLGFGAQNCVTQLMLYTEDKLSTTQ